MAGLGAAVAVGTVVAGPVLSAEAADRPNSLGDARKASATKLNAWVDTEALSSKKDQDWFRYDVPSASTVQVTLGALPADYSLALYGNNGKLITSSVRKGKQFERVTARVAAGSWFVKVFTPKSSSGTPYRMRLRVLPAGVSTLDQATYTKTWNGGRYARVNATFYNNATTWQSLRSWTLRYYDAAGTELEPPGTSIGSGDMDLNKVRIAPGGTVSVTTTWNLVPARTSKIVAAAVVTDSVKLPASGLSIALDSKRVNAISRGGGETYYWVKITNTGSKKASFAAQAKHFSTIGNLAEVGETWGDIGAGKTISRQLAVTTTQKVPNLLRFAVWKIS